MPGLCWTACSLLAALLLMQYSFSEGMLFSSSSRTPRYCFVKLLSGWLSPNKYWRCSSPGAELGISLFLDMIAFPSAHFFSLPRYFCRLCVRRNKWMIKWLIKYWIAKNRVKQVRKDPYIQSDGISSGLGMRYWCCNWWLRVKVGSVICGCQEKANWVLETIRKNGEYNRRGSLPYFVGPGCVCTLTTVLKGQCWKDRTELKEFQIGGKEHGRNTWNIM